MADDTLKVALAVEGSAADAYTGQHGETGQRWSSLEAPVKDQYRLRFDSARPWEAVDKALLLEEGTAAQLHVLDNPMVRPWWTGLREDIQEDYRRQARLLLANLPAERALGRGRIDDDLG